MLGRLSRTAAAVMMVGLIAGAAVAFSLGVPIHSAATCNNEVTYGTTCPGNPLTPFTVTSPGGSGGTIFIGANGDLPLTLNNPTGNPITANITLTYFGGSAAQASAKRLVIKKRVTIRPHHKLKLKLRAKGLKRGTLVIKLSDGKGHTRTVTKKVRAGRRH